MKEYLDRRIWHIENGLSYWCSICGEYKPESEFYKNKRTKWGVDRICKEHYRNENEDRDTSHLKFSNIRQSDFNGAVKLLESMGYDVAKGDIHQQFLQRHGEKLKPINDGKKTKKNGTNKQT